ncbi:hypothetical protein EAG_02460 [Camponotus floridanus]|uniref:Uncharacterized protein n=1 Tax=Camponotus floridanus TaxID=104421 RepID=E2AIJ3_CAMFO|nr:hypothetical protein EAG_02460 [Camponotus floridanus]
MSLQQVSLSFLRDLYVLVTSDFRGTRLHPLLVFAKVTRLRQISSWMNIRTAVAILCDFVNGFRLGFIATSSRMNNSAAKSNKNKRPVRKFKPSKDSVETSEVPTQTKARHSPAMRRRSNERMDSHRAKLSEQHDAKEKRCIYEELMFGYRSEVEVIRSLQIVSVPSSAIIPVTFRSVGFMCQFLYCKFAVLRINMPRCSIYNLFRVTLLQLEARVSAAMIEQCCRDIGSEDVFRVLKITLEQIL